MTERAWEKGPLAVVQLGDPIVRRYRLCHAHVKRGDSKFILRGRRKKYADLSQGGARLHDMGAIAGISLRLTRILDEYRSRRQ